MAGVLVSAVQMAVLLEVWVLMAVAMLSRVAVIVVHTCETSGEMLYSHTLLRMEQELDAVVRQRIRGLRLAKGWTLDALAARCYLSPSTLSRIETGHRRVALDQLVPIARALDTSLDQLVEAADDEDVVIRPEPHGSPGRTVWKLSRDSAPGGVSVAKMRMTPELAVGPDDLRVHPGREWFLVLSGTVRLRLGERVITVPAGQAAQFSTMVPHAITADGGPAEVMSIFDHDGERAHLRDAAISDVTGGAAGFAS